MGFEYNQRDEIQQFPCPDCDIGDISPGNNNNWVCDTCDFDYPDVATAEDMEKESGCG